MVLGFVRKSQLTADQMIAEGIAKKMASSENATIARYQNETQQIKDMKWVLVCAIVAGTSLMMLSVIAPFIIVGLIHVSLGSSPMPTGILNTVDKLTSTPGAVLPLATGLVGFAGGVVTAMFKTSTSAGAQVPPSQVPPVAVAKGPTQPVNTGTSVSLDGTQSRATTSGSSIVSYLWVQTGGNPVVLTGANTAKATFTAPNQATTLSFNLFVVDSTGAIGSPATVPVIVTQQ
jgi:hypothetical protein